MQTGKDTQKGSFFRTLGTIIQALRTGFQRLEDTALVMVLLGMLGLAVYQIVLRNFFGYSLSWIDPLNRVGVLWIALLGAMVGTRLDNHIKIDLASQLLPVWLGRWVKRLVALVAALALALLSWHTWRLVEDERAWGMASVAGIPVWQLQLIMPIAFGIMALRYAWMVFFPVLTPTALPTEDLAREIGPGAGHASRGKDAAS